MWKNLVTPAKSKVAETLDEFRGNYLYNLLDDNVRRFNAEIPQFVLWDDHEVRNNWFPGMSLEADDRYTEKSSRVLAAQARRAFLEYTPIRRRTGSRAADLSLVLVRPARSKCSRSTFARIARRTPPTADAHQARRRCTRARSSSHG